MENGVDKAIAAAGGGPDGKKALAELFGCKVQFINTCLRKGWFPTDRARQVADAYGIPLVDLVRADVRAALIANS